MDFVKFDKSSYKNPSIRKKYFKKFRNSKNSAARGFKPCVFALLCTSQLSLKEPTTAPKTTTNKAKSLPKK